MTTTTRTRTDRPPVPLQTTGAEAELGVPRPLTGNDLLVIQTVEEIDGAPALEPPGSALRATGITAVQSDRRISALWVNAATRNAYMHVTGIGWRRLNPANDWAWSAMVALASQARQTGCRIDYRDEADGLVHEIYLW
ncbi:MAG: hypothetical protein JWO60_2687 [Frankiales bacterium]|nr:hypothetical protein [Frankiales bacterium]